MAITNVSTITQAYIFLPQVVEMGLSWSTFNMLPSDLFQLSQIRLEFVYSFRLLSNFAQRHDVFAQTKVSYSDVPSFDGEL